MLPQAQATDIYLAAVAILLTLVYSAGLLFRPQRRILRMGVDSLIVLVLYLLAVAGLVAVARANPCHVVVSSAVQAVTPPSAVSAVPVT